MSANEFGIDQLRRAVRYFSWQNETFNMRFSARQLLAIRAYAVAHSELPEFADTWDDETIALAIQGVAP